MGITLKVSGAGVKFTLSNYEIRRYSFKYAAPNSRYAKGWEDERELVVVGDISRIIEKNRKTLDAIRVWAKTPYKDSETYYNSVKATYTYSDDVVREIEFTHAFVKDYYEKLDAHTGHGTFTIVFRQKVDKLGEMVIGPEGGALSASRGTLMQFVSGEMNSKTGATPAPVKKKDEKIYPAMLIVKNQLEERTLYGYACGIDLYCYQPAELFEILGMKWENSGSTWVLVIPGREERKTINKFKIDNKDCVKIEVNRDQDFLLVTAKTTSTYIDFQYEMQVTRKTASFFSTNMMIGEKNLFVKYYEMNPREMVIQNVYNDASVNTSLKWRDKGWFGTNASFFNPGRKTMTAFHINDGNVVHLGGDGNYAEHNDDLKGEAELKATMKRTAVNVMYLKRGEELPQIVGDRVSDIGDFIYKTKIQQKDLAWAIGGLELFLDDETLASGKEYIQKFKAAGLYGSGFGEYALKDGRCRTFIGLTDKGKLIIATVFCEDQEKVSDNPGKKEDTARNANFYEVRQIAQRIGCIKAMMLDGGGSTQISYKAADDGKTELVAKASHSNTDKSARPPLCILRVKSSALMNWGGGNIEII